MSLSAFFSIIVGLGLAGFAFAALIYSRKKQKTYEELARTSTFHCLRCDSVYTGAAGADLQACPKCGYRNTKLRF